MRIKKYHILPFAIVIILFLIPFSWLKPGEMDLGGDSSRLYFYNPLAYLQAETLYSVISSGTGGDAISFYSIPHMVLLAIFRLITIPTILLSIYNGIKLSVAFFSCYLIVKELIKPKEFAYRQQIIEISALLGGIFYLFSPILINSGWDRAILTHTQVFVNPLMFLLLLRYFVTRNIIYLLGALIITFIFSLNFSFIGTPSFFAFFPLSLVFLFIYTKYIKKTKIPVKQLLVGGILFFLLQAFHIIPHILSLLSTGSEYAGLFTDNTKFTRGLDYFTGIAPNIKVSISLLNLAQVRDITFLSLGFVVFPAVVIVGFLLNSAKKHSASKYTLLLSGIFFLITVFFASANITDIGFAFYKLLFYIPGFQMFRNFYGQWAFTFVFFYTLLFSQSFAVVISRIKKRFQIYFLTLCIVFIFVVTAWPFINGSIVNSVHFQSKNIKQNIKMDPVYEKVLNFAQALPKDGKILSLPLVGPGYQVLAGKEGGAYIGPSTFSYLVGKNDFTGYEGLKPYGDFFLQSVRDKNYSNLQKLFSLLNIQYIFYNSDPYIYDDNFPLYPYDYVKSFLPNSQKLYKEFINKLPIDKDKKIDFGDKYHFYPIKEELVFPHIYATTKTIYTTNPLAFSLGSNVGDQQHNAVFYFKNSRDEKDDIVLEPYTSSPLFLLQNNFHLHHHEPFITVKLDSISYPFALLKEKFKLWRAKKNHDRYVDLSFFYIAKRIFELENWSEIPVIKHEQQWQEPKLWEFYKWKKYNSWEASISRYKYAVIQLIQWTENAGESKTWIEANKIKINEQLYQHQTKLMKIIKSSNRSEPERAYLLSLVNKTLTELFVTLGLNFYDTFSLRYELLVPEKKSGEYEVYVEKDSNIVKEIQQIFMDVNGIIIKPLEKNENNNLIQFNNVDTGNFKNEKTINVVLHIPSENLLKNIDWESSKYASTATNAGILKINNVLGNNSGGLVQQIDEWKPNKQYLISFDYQTFGEDFIFKIYDKRIKEYSKKNLIGNIYLEKNLNSKIWKTHQSIVSADNKSFTGFIQILGNSEKAESELLIKNLSVVEIQYPKIFFKKIKGLKQKELTPPNVLFKKINPTKYKIEVTGASNPYALVFLEQFSKKWELIDISKNSNNFRRAVSRFFARAGMIVLSPFIKEKKIEDNIVASYFNGEVKEGIHQKTFLAPSTFETWGKDAIANDRHFQVNGYANGWNIQPKDMNEKTSYTLILEMTAQKPLYPLLFISLLTFVFILLYFFIRFFSVNGKTN